jgi:hypothetical protein
VHGVVFAGLLRTSGVLSADFEWEIAIIPGWGDGFAFQAALGLSCFLLVFCGFIQ